MNSPTLSRLALLLALTGCVSSELEVPTSHPGHPSARSAPVRRSIALGSAFDVHASAPADQSGHAEHRHDAAAAEQSTPAEPAPQGTPTEPARQTTTQPAAQGGPAKPAKALKPAKPSPPVSAVFTCPMHPEVIRNEPGNCPICGMKLVPKKESK